MVVGQKVYVWLFQDKQWVPGTVVLPKDPEAQGQCKIAVGNYGYNNPIIWRLGSKEIHTEEEHVAHLLTA